jgi:hypothetical protein
MGCNRCVPPSVHPCSLERAEARRAFPVELLFWHVTRLLSIKARRGSACRKGTCHGRQVLRRKGRPGSEDRHAAWRAAKVHGGVGGGRGDGDGDADGGDGDGDGDGDDGGGGGTLRSHSSPSAADGQRACRRPRHGCIGYTAAVACWRAGSHARCRKV